MAGTPRHVVVTGNPSSDVLACAAAINSLIDYIDTHTHDGVTTGSDASGAPTDATTVGKLYDEATGAAIQYTDG